MFTAPAAMPELPRRAALLLPWGLVPWGLVPWGLVACTGSGPPPVEGPPISYAHLTALRLDVASIDFEDRNPLVGPNDFGRELRPTPAEAVLTMGRDRLSAGGSQHKARFSVTQASITRARQTGGGGVFSADPGEQIAVRLACRLEILDENGRRLGFCEAETTRSRQAESNPAARLRAAESLLRQAMFDLNTEFEFQLRRALRAYLQEGSTTIAPPAQVEREALPPR
jgi:hypothetical protein